MKVLIGNKFLFELGGTERYVFHLEQMLRERGHQVILFGMRHPSNKPTAFERYLVNEIDYDVVRRSRNPLYLLQAALRTIYSSEAKKKILALVNETRPDVAHLHNIYHQITPSILPVLNRSGVPVIITLHDFKLVCPNYRMYSSGVLCERCTRGAFYNALTRRCLKDSFAASAIAMVEAYLHAVLRTYERNVSALIAPSRFMQTVITRSALNKIETFHLPHPINISEYQPEYKPGSYFVYFGRLTKEKGVSTLLRALSQIRSGRLIVAGDGPERRNLEELAHRLGLHNVAFVGFRQGEALQRIVRNSLATVVPSEWYENSPFTIYESFALGKPVIASDIGGIPELVDHGQNGLLFPRGDVDALAERLSYLTDHPARASEMGRLARCKAESKWGYEQHYQALQQVYRKVLCREGVP